MVPILITASLKSNLYRKNARKTSRIPLIRYIRNKVLPSTAAGFRLVSDLSDEQIGRFVDEALNQLQPYIDTTVFVTVPFAKCIDLTGFDHDSITHVYRVEGFTGDTTTGVTTSDIDPLYVQT